MSSLVVLTQLERVLDTATAGAPRHARSAFRLLRSRGVPVVLSSDGGPAGLLSLHQELGLSAPFICNGGATLYVPSGYFGACAPARTAADGWEVIECGVGDDDSHAVHLVAALFRCLLGNPLIVAAAARLRDRVLLEEADVPVIVYCPDEEQVDLLCAVPDAYVTNAPGLAGWEEAILGAVPERDARPVWPARTAPQTRATMHS